MVASWKEERDCVKGEVKIDNQNLDQPKWWRAGLIDS